MEKMPYRAELEQPVLRPATATAVVTSDWQQALPVLRGRSVTLRELRTSDAPALFSMLTAEEVSRFISPPPSTVEGFERFIGWAARQRALGAYVCFAVTLKDSDTAIGIFQVRSTEPGFGTAEWGFALGSSFWGTGIFQEGAELVINFAFETLGVHRLEARAAVKNGRGNGALRKIGAVQEGVLRKSFLRNGEYLDQVMYGVIEDDWRASRTPVRLDRMDIH
jgi:RimJ/RimL family protein N-acetyltransferase